MANEIVTQQDGAAQLPAVAEESANMMALITRAATDPAVNVDKMRALLDFKRELQKDQAELAFNQAFAKLMLKLPRIKKDGSVEYPVDKNRPDGPKRKAFDFATYEGIDEVIRPLLQEYGFYLSFTSEPRQGDGGGAVVVGTLSHVEGHSRTAKIGLALDASGGKNNIQGMGSTFSYGKRYTTCALLNIVTEGQDDDGVQGGMRYVTEETAKQIERLIADTKTVELDFCHQFFGVTEVRNIPFDAGTAALNMLQAKKARIGGK